MSASCARSARPTCANTRSAACAARATGASAMGRADVERPPLRVGDHVTVDAPSLGYHGRSGTVSWAPNRGSSRGLWRDSSGLTLAEASELEFAVSLAESAALIVVEFTHPDDSYYPNGRDTGHFQRDHLRLDAVTRLGRLAE